MAQLSKVLKVVCWAGSVWRCMCVPTKCECGMSVSFHHVMFSCTSCSDHFQPLTGKLRSVGLPLCTKSTAVERAIAQCTSRWAMARGHRLNTSIVLAAVHGLSGLFRAVSAVEPITLALFPTLSPSLIGHPASVDVKQHKSQSDQRQGSRRDQKIKRS